jgi:hypothetical protein
MIYSILGVVRSDVMDTNSPVYAQLNKAWKSTCKVLFGEEIGELKEYEEWLKEYMPVTGKRKSHVSGKDVTVAFDDYCKDARFVSLDEVKEKSIEPLTINEIKDIDSIVEAISEKWEYVGNRILGNSRFIEHSDIIFDSNYVSDSFYVDKSTYVFGSSAIRTNSKYIFGSAGYSNSEFVVRSLAASNCRRHFECIAVDGSSDLFFCANNDACSDLMFSFNQRSKRYMIGNLQLPKEKYFQLKNKLIEEIRTDLKRDKRFPSLIELISDGMPEINVPIKSKKETTNLEPIEKGFSSTFKILFRKDIYGVDNYEKWLSRHAPMPLETTSPFGQRTYMPKYTEYPDIYYLWKKRLVSQDESLILANSNLEEKNIVSLNKLKENLGKIAYFTLEIHEGVFYNIIKTPVAYNASNIYETGSAILSEYAAINSAIGMNAKYVFGSNRLTDSQFCINSYYSSKLTRCFEVDNSINCSDTYFAHNCEGLHEAMFCWNAKGKRYAIGNTELPPEQYRKIKDMLIEQMADEIIKTKQLRYDIYNIGCRKV